MTKTKESSISEAVEDVSGRKFFRFGTEDRNVWLSFEDVAALDRTTINRLSSVGVQIATTQAKEALKRSAEAHTDFKLRSIAEYPGYLDNAYVLGDGHVQKRRKTPAPIIAFRPDERFTPPTSLVEWQRAIAPIVAGQPLILFGLAFALVGPLLRYAPSDCDNPFAELVGPPGAGKSTLAKLMSSMWGGSGNRLGICQSWDYSPAELDVIRREAKDRLLVIDEAAKAGDTPRERSKKIATAVFRLSDTAPRRVFGSVPPPPVRQAILSTSNVPMRELVGTATEVENAILSRVLTLVCGRPFGILDTVPRGFSTAREAIEALDRAAADHFASAADHFLSGVFSHTDGALTRSVKKAMKRAAARGLLGTGFGARQEKTLALTYAAGLIAQHLGVIPTEWGDMDDILRSITETTSTTTPKAQTALDWMLDYIQKNRGEIPKITDASLPLTSGQLHAVAGVWIEPNRLLVIPTTAMPKWAGRDSLLRYLKRSKRLDHDHGKFSKKLPRAIASHGRGYFVDVGLK